MVKIVQKEKTIKIGKKPVVILPLEEYERLKRMVEVPTHRLSGKAAERLDRLVREGLKDYRRGKCKKLKSLADLD